LGVTYLHGDHLGTASLTTGATSNSARYLPFGGTRWESGVATDLRFTGQRQESGFGLYDFNARYYDPTIGRFISADTIVPNPDNPQDLNRYGYTRNNPLRHIDPTGHECVPCEMVLRTAPAFKGLSVTPAAPAAAATVFSVIAFAGMFELGLWATGDNGPAYELPNYGDSIVQPTSPFAGTTTLTIGTGFVYARAQGAVQGMAAHLGYTFGAPLGGWDPNKKPKSDNSLKDNADHIIEDLKGIQKNLKNGEDLRSFLQKEINNANRFNSLTKRLDDYIFGLQDGEWLREQIGKDLSDEILGLLKNMGYTPQ
jgi:RHS repeat-associated protein